MSKEELNKLTYYIAEKYMRGAYNYLCNRTKDDYYEKTCELLDVIASLHNLLYKEVTGETFDCMSHWCNKCGYGGIDDYIFDEIIDMEFEDIKKEV